MKSICASTGGSAYPAQHGWTVAGKVDVVVRDVCIN